MRYLPTYVHINAVYVCKMHHYSLSMDTPMYTILYPRDFLHDQLNVILSTRQKLNCLRSLTKYAIHTLCRSLLVVLLSCLCLWICCVAVEHETWRGAGPLAVLCPCCQRGGKLGRWLLQLDQPHQRTRQIQPTNLHACTIAVYMYVWLFL